MATRIEGVLFDAVGTLIAPRRPVGATYQAIAAHHGVEAHRDRLESAFRAVFPAMDPMAFPDRPRAARERCERDWWRELVRRTFDHALRGRRIPHFDALFDDLFSTFGRPDAWSQREGAQESLAALRRAGRRSAVLSNFDHRLPGVLDGLGFGQAFEFVMLPGEAGAAKPDPQIFRCALERFGLRAARVALVGDDPHDDLEGAQDAGMHGVDVRELATLGDLESVLRRLERRNESSRGEG